MARALGSIGLVRKEFETEFWRFCHDNDFLPGAECARLMQRAAKENDVRMFVSLAAVMLKSGESRDAEAEKQQPLLVVDRTSDSNAA